MKTKAVRLYGKMDLRLEEFELPQIAEDEILVRVVSDSICMSSYKAALLGAEHKRVPDDVANNPIIIGHELAGEVVEVGSQWKDRYQEGMRFSLQPALNYQGSMKSPGYSYPYCGGDATYMILPREVMIMDCLLPYRGEGFFKAALSEPYSCVIGACRSLFRTDRHNHNHYMGIREGGKMAIIGGCGPMGLAAIDYALSGEFRPNLLVVTDLDDRRIQRARELFEPKAAKQGISLLFVNTGTLDTPKQDLMKLTGGDGFDDILVMVPSAGVLELSESLLGFNGCLNFFAGPTDTSFSARVNYYDIHYLEKHIIGTTGGTVDDMREALKLMEEDKTNVEVLVTHVGGLDAAAQATLHLPEIPGGKKLIYTGIQMPLIALEDLPDLSSQSDLYKGLAEIVGANRGLWSVEAENYLLKNAPAI
ncbi:zinc-binding dehydrogenase [Spirochaeta lutea]|uniref:L-sorbose 1-phosphate reductase n=1 Tax=Spirochaeta lutea TaxID=1480694 RepID=A0A098QWV0_9SPIO|nr:zinc-binding dehydrogenase [Spirochaeta lutea]KGE70972.1 L-sorbose 1-phosphate reductase [Spirochaeta lutea]